MFSVRFETQLLYRVFPRAIHCSIHANCFESCIESDSPWISGLIHRICCRDFFAFVLLWHCLLPVVLPVILAMVRAALISIFFTA